MKRAPREPVAVEAALRHVDRVTQAEGEASLVGSGQRDVQVNDLALCVDARNISRYSPLLWAGVPLVTADAPLAVGPCCAVRANIRNTTRTA